MTFPAITGNNQTHASGGIQYVSNLAQMRWKRKGLYAAPLPGSITTEMLAPGSVDPTKIDLAVTRTGTPPAIPSTTTAYLVTAPATGAFAGHVNEIAIWDGAGWDFTPPREGMIVWDEGGNHLLAYDAGIGWFDIIPDRLQEGQYAPDPNTLTMFGAYWSYAGSPNLPDTINNWRILHLPWVSAGSHFDTQIAFVVNGATNVQWIRTNSGGAWLPWERFALTIGEMDSRYVQASTIINRAVQTRTIYNVADRDLTSLPSSPTTGVTYYVGFTIPHVLATWDGSAWEYVALKEGDLVWIADEDKLGTFNGTSLDVNGASQAQEYRISFTDGAGGIRTLSATTPWPASTLWSTLFPAQSTSAWGGFFSSGGSGGFTAGPGQAIGEFWDQLWDSSRNIVVNRKQLVDAAFTAPDPYNGAPGNGNF